MKRPALSANRAMTVINFLAAHPTERFSLSALAQHLDINVASLHTVLTTLTEGGYLERHPRHRTYSLGPALVAIGQMALAQNPLVEAARDEARALSDRLQLDVSVCARSGADVTVVAHSGIRHTRGLSLLIGERMPLRAPLGTIFFAWADDETLERFLTGAADDEREKDREGIRAVATRGFSVTVEAGAGADGTPPTDHLITIEPRTTYRVSSISGPIFDAYGSVALTIALVGFPAGLSGREVFGLGAEVRDACLLVTRRTRGAIPPMLAAPAEPVAAFGTRPGA